MWLDPLWTILWKMVCFAMYSPLFMWGILLNQP
jgi:hypothetical protein